MEKGTEGMLKEPASPSEEFIASISKEIAREIKRRVVEKDSDYPDDIIEEDTRLALECEKEFCRKVTTVYEAWSREPEPVILWDIDDTMGKHVLTNDDYVWRFRPALLPLIEHLQQQFPNARNGIISNRTRLAEQLDEPENLQAVSGFIDPQHLYSSRDMEPSAEVRQYFEERGEYPDSDHMAKLTILWNLREQGVNVKIIDDNQAAKTMGKDGLYTWRTAPRV